MQIIKNSDYIQESRPLISIAIPIKNRAWCLSYLIKSIESQDFPKNKLEIIFVDNMSTDGTYDLLKKWQKKAKNYWRVVITRSTGNLATVRNLCIKLARGDYILFMDSDIIFPKDAISRIYKHTVREDIDIFHFPCIPESMNITFKLLTIHEIRNIEKGGIKEVMASRVEFGFTLFRRRFFEKIGFFKEDSNLVGKRGNWADMLIMYEADKHGFKALVDYNIKVTHFKDFNPRIFFNYCLSKGHSRFLINLIREGDLFHFYRLLYYIMLPIILITPIFLRIPYMIYLPSVIFYLLISLIWNINSRPDKFTICIARAFMNICCGVLLSYSTILYICLNAIQHFYSLLKSK